MGRNFDGQIEEGWGEAGDQSIGGAASCCGEGGCCFEAQERAGGEGEKTKDQISRQKGPLEKRRETDAFPTKDLKWLLSSIESIIIMRVLIESICEFVGSELIFRIGTAIIFFPKIWFFFKSFKGLQEFSSVNMSLPASHVAPRTNPARVTYTHEESVNSLLKVS